MATRMSRMLNNREILEALRKGIETKHFKARVSWPQGFDGDPVIRVSMNFTEFRTDEWSNAEDEMHETLTMELNDLYRRAHDLTHAITIFAIDRDTVRAGMNPNVGRVSCLSGVYEKKAAAV